MNYQLYERFVDDILTAEKGNEFVLVVYLAGVEEEDPVQCLC